MRILVTGAGPDSLGLATARALAAQGHEVLTSTRSTPVDGFGWHPLDLADRDSVAAFAGWVSATGTLDVLVNNAGIHLDLRSKWSEPQLVDGQEIHWRTNYFGTAQLTRALLPALLDTGARTGDARIVNVVSKLHARGRNADLLAEGGPWRSGAGRPYDSWAAYGTSKLGLMHDAAELNRVHEAGGVRAVSLHPGSVLTRVADAGLANSPVFARLRTLGRPIERRMLLSPEQGAATSVFAATAPDVVGGGYYVKSAPAEPSADAADGSVRGRLADLTEEWLAAGTA